ncbi:hypothetical protein C8J43_101757 [Sphingomonas sp. PP-CE-1G-424]|nr:hypothetical protein C8J43_101757 [Sphingomonas sp. PP-CE-1G-424]
MGSRLRGNDDTRAEGMRADTDRVTGAIQMPISVGRGRCGSGHKRALLSHGADTPAAGLPHTTGPPAAASTRHFAGPATVTVPSPLFVTCAV